MLFNFEPNLIERFLWENSFSNFGHVNFIRETKIRFWPPFFNKAFLDRSFC